MSAIEFVEPEDLVNKTGSMPMVSDPNEEPEFETAGQSEEDRVDDDRLEYTQRMRETVIGALAPGGKISDDMKVVDRILATLDGIDRAVHSKRRTKQADKQIQNDAAIAKLLEKAQLEAERKNITGYTSAPTREKNALDPGFLKQPVTLEGEFKDQAEQETSADFFERMENDNPDLRRGGAQ